MDRRRLRHHCPERHCVDHALDRTTNGPTATSRRSASISKSARLSSIKRRSSCRSGTRRGRSASVLSAALTTAARTASSLCTTSPRACRLTTCSGGSPRSTSMRVRTSTSCWWATRPTSPRPTRVRVPAACFRARLHTVSRTHQPRCRIRMPRPLLRSTVAPLSNAVLPLIAHLHTLCVCACWSRRLLASRGPPGITGRWQGVRREVRYPLPRDERQERHLCRHGIPDDGT